MNTFQKVKSAVSTKDAAIFYGIKVKRNRMACCPFHPDKHPSMIVDNRYHCFACGADGDVINFVEELFHLSPMDATKKLIADFGLDIEVRKPYKPTAEEIKREKEQEELRAFLLYKRDALNYLHDYYYILHCAKRDYAPTTPEELEHCHPLFEEAVKNIDTIDWLMDMIENSKLDEQKEFIKKYQEVISNAKERVDDIRKSKAR